MILFYKRAKEYTLKHLTITFRSRTFCSVIFRILLEMQNLLKIQNGKSVLPLHACLVSNLHKDMFLPGTCLPRV